MRRIFRSPETSFKLLSAFCVIGFYLIYTTLYPDSQIRLHHSRRPARRPIQYLKWPNDTSQEDPHKMQHVVEAMKHTFWNYKAYAWGEDGIKPVSGEFENSRNGWGAFIVDSSTTVALMGLWKELGAEVRYIVESIDFDVAKGLVDPFETTIRYVGGLVSLVELIDAGQIPDTVVSKKQRDALLEQAELLGKKLLPAYKSPSRLPYPRVNFTSDKGEDDPPEVYLKNPNKPRYLHPAVGPARAGTNILENYVLSTLTGLIDFFAVSQTTWAPLVWNPYPEPDIPGLPLTPLDILTGAPVGLERSWDAGHDSYYEYLLKASLLMPRNRYAQTYSKRWLQAADSLRAHLTSRSAPTSAHYTQHLFLGSWTGPWYKNTQSHLSCFAAGNLMLGGAHLGRRDLITLGQALLEGCRHTYAATPTGLGGEVVAWQTFAKYPNGTFAPETERHAAQHRDWGFWMPDPSYNLRPEYVESLFYAWRITGEQRYRDWAWEAFVAVNGTCRTPFGYAGVQDVTLPTERWEGKVRWVNESESFWAAETLKYFWLIFADVKVGSLDEWVFTTEGHPLRRDV